MTATLPMNGDLLFTPLSQANAGTAGGTMYYINLGGMKILWCNGSNVTSGVTPTAYTFTLPTGFFSTIQSANSSSINPATSLAQYSNVASANTTTVTCNVTSALTGTTGINIMVIGT